MTVSPRKSPPKTAVIEAGGVKAHVTYKRIKKLYLRVKDDGAVTVSAPVGTSKEFISRFVSANTGYISRRLSEIGASERRCETGETVRMWGESYTLLISPGSRRSAKKDDGSKTVTITAPPDSSPDDRKKALIELYRREVKSAAALRIPALETVTGLYSSGLSVKDMRSRWGSCNVRTKHISLSLRLAMYPPRCLDQVIVHELIHTAVPNHGPDFHAMMDRLMPDWRVWRDELNRVKNYI